MRQKGPCRQRYLIRGRLEVDVPHSVEDGPIAARSGYEADTGLDTGQDACGT